MGCGQEFIVVMIAHLDRIQNLHNVSKLEQYWRSKRWRGSGIFRNCFTFTPKSDEYSVPFHLQQVIRNSNMETQGRSRNQPRFLLYDKAVSAENKYSNPSQRLRNKHFKIRMLLIVEEYEMISQREIEPKWFILYFFSVPSICLSLSLFSNDQDTRAFIKWVLRWA